jgi:hypothetical protein
MFIIKGLALHIFFVWFPFGSPLLFPFCTNQMLPIRSQKLRPISSADCIPPHMCQQLDSFEGLRPKTVVKYRATLESNQAQIPTSLFIVNFQLFMAFIELAECLIVAKNPNFVAKIVRL